MNAFQSTVYISEPYPYIRVGGDSSVSQNSTNSSSNKTSTTTIVAGAVVGVVLLCAAAMGAFFFFRKRKDKALNPRAYTIDAYSGLGLGQVRGSGGPALAEETAPFVAPTGLGTPYMDNPYQRGSMSISSHYSSAPSESMFVPAMQARGSNYAVASNRPPEIMSYSTQPSPPNSMRSLPPAGPAAPRALMAISTRPESFDPYRSSVGATIAPSTPTESTSGMVAGPSMGLAYAVSSTAGSSSKMTMAVDESGPSTSRVADPTPVPGTTNVKQGAVPPQPRQQSVYQHEDVSDAVEELPPAYKERTEGH